MFTPVAVALGALISLAHASAAHAATYNLKRLSLVNVNDAAGRWQFEGGQVFQNSTHVANYAVVRRVVFGGTDRDGQNTAMVTMEFFFLGKGVRPGAAPENITFQGSHSFSSGDEIGSVSAASPLFAGSRGRSFSRKGNTVTF
jgi:hypothetical protein